MWTKFRHPCALNWARPDILKLHPAETDESSGGNTAGRRRTQMAKPKLGNPREVDSITGMLERIEQACADRERIKVGDLRDAIGVRSFGPLLLLLGIILISPLAGTPGVPTAFAVLIILIVGQLLIGRETFWLPNFVLQRQMRCMHVIRALGFLKKPSHFVDRFVGRRLSALTRRPFTYLIAMACVGLAILMPPLEFIPFANVSTAAGIAAFGLALIARDGVLALIAFALTAVSLFLVVTMFF